MQRHLRSLQGGFGGKNRSLSGSESDIARHDSMLDASRIRTHTHTHIYIYIYACVFLGSSRWPATAAASVVEFVFILASGAARIRPHPISHWFVFWIRLLDPSFGSVFWIRLLDPSSLPSPAAVERARSAPPPSQVWILFLVCTTQCWL